MLNESLVFLEDFPVGVCLIGSDLRVKMWNRRLEVWTGYDASELIGEDARRYFPKLLDPRYVNRLELLFQGGAPAIFSALLHTDFFTPKAGMSNRSVFNTTAMAKESDVAGKYDILFVVEDVTAFHKRTQQLEMTNAQLESFIHAASHDLRAPLRRISGFSHLIRDELEEFASEEVRSYLDFLIKQSKQLDKLLLSLLDYSRATSGELILRESSLNDALDRALMALQDVIEEKNAKVTREALPQIACDIGLMTLVLQNLVANAMKYNKSERITVEIFCKQMDGKHVICVKDNGIGVDDNYREAIFMPFKRLHSGDEFLGSGIGLSTCRNIIRRHEGRIWVEPNPEGGSIFCFYTEAMRA